MYKVLEVSCFLLICAWIDRGLGINTSVSLHGDNESVKQVVLKNLSSESNTEELHPNNSQNPVDETVRSFLPLKGKQKWLRKLLPFFSEMLFFNTTVIGDNEEVTLAQLHLHRRRLIKTHDNYHKKFLPSPYRVVLYQVQPNFRRRVHDDAKTMKLASLPVSHRTRGGWHTLDVTPVLRELLINAQGSVELLLGVKFEAPKKFDDPQSSPLVPIKHFLKNPSTVTPDHPHKTSSYLVVFSEIDPFFDDFEYYDDFLSTSNFKPTSFPDVRLKERHFKHKNKAEESSLNQMDKENASAKSAVKKDAWKLKLMENEVFKVKKGDEIRHKGKNKGNEVIRSKADELALKEKTKLKSVPFLHANEVEEIRQTSRRLTRSSGFIGSQARTLNRDHSLHLT